MAGLSNKVLTIPPFITNDSMIADGVIVASKITVSDLSAISANLGTITAGTITGVVIQTASNYPRISLNQVSDSMTVYDGSGNSVVQIAGINATGGLIYISPNSTSAQALSIAMPSGSSSSGISIINPGIAPAIFIDVEGSGSAIGISATTSDITNPMVSIGDGGFQKNLFQIESSYSGSLSNIMLDLQKLSAGAGTVLNINNNGIGTSLYISQNNSSNGDDVIYITSAHGGRVMEIDQINSSNSNTVLYVTTQNAAVAPIFASGGYVATHFSRCLQVPGGAVIWGSDGTNPSGTLSANAGDICLNTGGGHMAYCTGGTSWTQL